VRAQRDHVRAHDAGDLSTDDRDLSGAYKAPSETPGCPLKAVEPSRRPAR
jgi:hypothetical protein